jgi:acetyltransferase-like isoleucine patch superfamily enzyme
MARRSHGSGKFEQKDLLFCGEGVVIEDEVLIWHPETVSLGADVYIGHRTMLKGYYKGKMTIGRGTWIGQNCFFHSAGNITIGEDVGIGPQVQILTSTHRLDQVDKPLLQAELEFKHVVIEKDSDIGMGTIILPGVTIGQGAQIGAGSVITQDVPPYAVAAGVPAKVLRSRK